LSTIAISGAAVAQLVTYIAPGFIARLAWRLRYPAADSPAGETLIVSVVASLPLVAVVQALLPGAQTPDELEYVVPLLVVSAAAGYGSALVRSTPLVRRLMARAGYRLDPPGTLYSQTLALMSPSGSVIVELKDGRRIWGVPRKGPQHKLDGIGELYLVFPKSLGDDGDWSAVGEGLIVPLDQIVAVALSEEPTGALAES
jgi:hypothetical protein